VQHEREPLGRGERLEHDQQRQPDRVREQRLVLGVRAVRKVDDRVGDVHVLRQLASRVTRAQHVQRHARDHGRQPPAEVLHPAGVRAAEPQPRVLDGVLGLAERSADPVGHRPQVRTVLLELVDQQVLLCHVSSPLGRVT
jgi:hypothetical protein